MSIYFCQHCKNAFLPENTSTDGHRLFCLKCNLPLANLGSEEGQVSLQAHLESKERVDKKALYHEFSLIKSKHYKVPKKDPILLDCEAKLRINPLNTDALFTLSQWYYSHGMVHEAQAIANQILRIDPNFKKAHDLLIKTNQNDTGESLDLPEDIKLLETIAIKHITSKRFQQAEHALNKILTMDNKHRAARRYLAEIHTERGAYTEAIHELNRLAMQYPEDDQILFNLAVACYNANDFPRSISNLKAAKKITNDPDLVNEINQFMGHLDQINTPSSSTSPKSDH